MKNLRFSVVYNQPVVDQGYKLVDSFGHSVIESYYNGVVNYEQTDYFATLEEAQDRARTVKLITEFNGKKKYNSIKIVENN